jgi:energy-converting hydrogenase Eha subunit C
VLLTLQLAEEEEDHYYSLDDLDAALKELESDGFKRVNGLRLEVGRFAKDRDSAEGNLRITITFSASTSFSATAPAIQGEVSGGDREVVDGVRNRIADAMRRGKPRLPSPPFMLMYMLTYIVGAIYGVALAASGLLDLVPGGAILGPILTVMFLFAPSVALGYLVLWSGKRVLPPVQLLGAGRPGRTAVWRGRVVRFAAAVVVVAPLGFQVYDRVAG